MEVYEKEPNKVAEPRGRAQWLIILLVLFVSICAVVLSIGAMILAVRTGNDQESNQMQIVNTVTSDVEALKNLTESQAAALKSLQDLYQELNNKVIEVQMQIINTVTSDVEAQIRNLTESQAAALKSLQDLYQELNNKVIEVQMQIVDTASSDVEAQIKNLTESQAAVLKSLQDLYQGLNNKVIEVQMENTIQVQVLNRSVSALKAVVESGRTVSASNELDLTAGCPAPIGAQCPIQRLNVGTPPASAACETGPAPLEVDGFRNVNIYCSVDNSGGETNPVTSTLNIYNGEVSCLCNLVALTAPTADIVCTLNIQRCPETVRLNTTNMQ